MAHPHLKAEVVKNFMEGTTTSLTKLTTIWFDIGAHDKFTILIPKNRRIPWVWDMPRSNTLSADAKEQIAREENMFMKGLYASVRHTCSRNGRQRIPFTEHSSSLSLECKICIIAAHDCGSVLKSYSANKWLVLRTSDLIGFRDWHSRDVAR